MQSRLDKGREGTEGGNRRCSAKEDNFSIKSYLGVSEMEMSVGIKKALRI